MADENTQPGKQAMAQDRTDLAEDRTVLANERTFAGWMRTGLAAIGIGIGFNALFGRFEPIWVPRALATLFMLIGIFIFWAAERRACTILSRLDAHHVETFGAINVRMIAIALTIGALAVIAAIWLLRVNV